MGNGRFFSMRSIGWPAAAIIAATILAVELLPVAFGTGENAVWDWGFLYVTFRFVLLPLICAIHIAANLLFLGFSSNRPATERLKQLASVIVTVAFLGISYSYPLPLFKGAF
jgi:hypothetical protein